MPAQFSRVVFARTEEAESNPKHNAKLVGTLRSESAWKRVPVSRKRRGEEAKDRSSRVIDRVRASSLNEEVKLKGMWKRPGYVIEKIVCKIRMLNSRR